MPRECWWRMRPASSRKGTSPPRYSDTAGQIENCQFGVFLTYVSSRERTLLDRELYLPQV